MIQGSESLLAFWLILAASAATAHAQEPPAQSEQEKETARALYKLGNERFIKGDLGGALDAFLGAHRIMQAPTTGLGLGKTQLELGSLLSARETLSFVAAYPSVDGEPESFTLAREEAQALLAELEGQIPTLEVRVSGGEQEPLVARVILDGRALSQAELGQARDLDPGTHVVQVDADGFVPTAVSVELERRESRVLHVTLAPLPPPPPPPAEPTKPAAPAEQPSAPIPTTSAAPAPPASSVGSSLAVAGFSIAGVALVAGALTGGLSLSAAADLERVCAEDKTCPPSAESLRDRTLTMAHVSTTSFVVAGVGAVIGIVGVTIDVGPEPKVALRVGPSGIYIEGAL